MTFKRSRVWIGVAVFLIAIMSFGTATAFAASHSSNTGIPKIKHVEYDQDGEVNVDFYGKVSYKRTKVAVTDTAGNKYTAKIRDRDRNELEFYVPKIKTGTSYSFTISGIKSVGAKQYTVVEGDFDVPDAPPVTIESLEYDWEDQELSIDFESRVCWQDETPVITISQMDGTVIETDLVDWDRDSVDLFAELEPGQEYQYSITGVSSFGETEYTTLSGTFITEDDDYDYNDDEDDDDEDDDEEHDD